MCTDHCFFLDPSSLDWCVVDIELFTKLVDKESAADSEFSLLFQI